LKTYQVAVDPKVFRAKLLKENAEKGPKVDFSHHKMEMMKITEGSIKKKLRNMFTADLMKEMNQKDDESSGDDL
jgi:hypothetical protein